MSAKRPQKKVVTPNEEREAARQTADLAAMRRMLEVSAGCFSLSFAVCNDRTLRNELIARLREDFPGILLVDLVAATPDIYQVVRTQVAGQSPAAIFVLDAEASIPSEGNSSQSLRLLNHSREMWERFACPVVFWLAEYAATQVARLAPDFWRYRSHLFEFVADGAHVRAAIAERFSGFEMVEAR